MGGFQDGQGGGGGSGAGGGGSSAHENNFVGSVVELGERWDWEKLSESLHYASAGCCCCRRLYRLFC